MSDLARLPGEVVRRQKRKALLVAMCRDLADQQKKNDMYSPF
jgi:hypothetical protein